MSANPPKVAVLMGSKNDWSIMQAACEQLDALGIANEARVISAHRTPQRHHDFVTTQAPAEGVKVFICGAGMAAALAACSGPRSQSARTSHNHTRTPLCASDARKRHLATRSSRPFTLTC